MGSQLSVFLDTLHLPSLQAVSDAVASAARSRQENEQAKAALVARFEKPGLRLKMRLLLEQLQREAGLVVGEEGSTAAGAASLAPTPAAAAESGPADPATRGSASSSSAGVAGAITISPIKEAGEVDHTDDEDEGDNASEDGDGDEDDEDEAEETAAVQKRMDGAEEDEAKPSASAPPSAASEAAPATGASDLLSPLSVAAQERPLWKQVLDKNTGKPYWYNRLTKETTWFVASPLPADQRARACVPVRGGPLLLLSKRLSGWLRD